VGESRSQLDPLLVETKIERLEVDCDVSQAQLVALLTIRHGVVDRRRVVGSDANAAIGDGSGSGEGTGEESGDTKGGEEHGG
jgi:hypothetical protein